MKMSNSIELPKVLLQTTLEMLIAHTSPKFMQGNRVSTHKAESTKVEKRKYEHRTLSMS
uniref:Uncharacterized protein n=1 Tax=Arundo donax TaxID=35708 RepID=A0A0A9GWN6_ARUDO